MFLRIILSVTLFLLPVYIEASLFTTEHYELKDAEKDITILKSILVRYPGDLKNLKRIINVTFAMEYFDQTEKYCEDYLAIEKNIEIAYLKILASASMGKFQIAADQIEPFIGEYKDELNSTDINMLKFRVSLYRKSTETRGFPSGSVKTFWGENSVIKSYIPRESLFTGYNYKSENHNLFNIIKDAAAKVENYPDYLSGISGDSINFVSISDDGREVLISSDSGNSSSIHIRKYLADKKRWSSWEKPSELNPGRWNHYPNFINNDTILFSSADKLDYDIYISHRDKDGNWSDPEKLSGINTPLDEISIWVHPDGETVYFSSNGYEGMGGFDIYGARLNQKKNSFEVTGIKNITPVNTFRNEKHPLFVTQSGDQGYFNFREGNNRSVYICNDNNFKPVPVIYYTAEIIDDTTQNPVKGSVIEYTTSNAEYSFSRPVYSDGFTATALRLNMSYTITVTAEGYKSFTKKISPGDKDPSINDKIRMKKTSESIADNRVKSSDMKAEIQGYTTLITALKLSDCEKSISAPIDLLLEKEIGGGPNKDESIKNIISLTVCGNTGCALSYGKTVKADFVVFGNLAKTKQSAMKTLGDSGEDQYISQRVTGATYILELKFIEVSTGEVLVSFKKSTGNTGALKYHTKEFIKKTESFYKKKK